MIRPIILHFIFLALMLYSVTSSGENSDTNPRMREPFNSTWKFFRFGLQPDGSRMTEPGALSPLIKNNKLTIAAIEPIDKIFPMAELNYDDSKWRKLNLPHDWGIEGPFRIDLEGNTGKLPWKGIGWYRKDFFIPESDLGKRIFIDFDGVMANARVYCNGVFVGTWPYGYNSFRFELTSALNFGQKNIIAVRTDTENWDSRWYPGAGIYRNVWLVKTSAIHVGHWGTFITTTSVSKEKATINLSVAIENQSEKKIKASIETTIYELSPNDQPGQLIIGTFPIAKITIDASSVNTKKLQVELRSPHLWQPGQPNRYVARTLVKVKNKIVDNYDTPFGIRSIQPSTNDGFLVNGKRIQIKGVCMHHDLGALGAAFNTRAAERQLEILAQMGVNAIRCSHNPPAPELLDLCDKKGFLVWDESFDALITAKRENDYSKLFNEWHEKDIEAMVHRDRNHPSVVIWSFGNEGRDQANVALAQELTGIFHREDPTRPVSYGYSNPNGARSSGAAKFADIMGINYRFEQERKWHDDPVFGKKPTIGSETSSCVSSRGEYFFPDDQTGNHKGINKGRQQNWQVSSYDTDNPGWGCTPDKQFETNAKYPWLMGEFVWTGFDYLGEPTPYNSKDNTLLLNFLQDAKKMANYQKELEQLNKEVIPSRSSYFGIVDLAGFPKDRFYLYKSQWQPDVPMAHLLPHWNWPERIGKITPVHVYTSGDTGELFLNGKSQGIRKIIPGKTFRLVWDSVIYQPGVLKVIVTKNGKPWAEDIVKTTEKPSEIKLSADRRVIATDRNDISFITVKISDTNGQTVPRSNNLITFSINGPGEIVATDNGDATSLESFSEHKRHAFNGLALVIVKFKPGANTPFVLHAESENLTGASVKISPEN